jgi:8-oxo-dGTP diphosphatase
LAGAFLAAKLAGRKENAQSLQSDDDFIAPARQNGHMTQPLPLRTPSPVLAVGAVIWNDKKEIVLIRRGQAPRKGQWSIPGGKVDWGETLRDALLREVREETSLSVDIMELIEVVDSVTRDVSGAVAHHYVLIDFTASWVSGELKAGGDAQDARWVAYDRIGEYELWSETQRIIAASERASAGWLGLV